MAIMAVGDFANEVVDRTRDCTGRLCAGCRRMLWFVAARKAAVDDALIFPDKLAANTPRDLDLPL